MVFISVTVFERKPHDPRSRETVTVARSTNARTDIPSSRVSLFASPLPLFVSSTPLRIMELLRGRGAIEAYLTYLERCLPFLLATIYIAHYAHALSSRQSTDDAREL